MPGVPSGRGCDACRKQKKKVPIYPCHHPRPVPDHVLTRNLARKCDATVPLCSRCARLGIACVGSGAKRYKFVEQHRTSPSAVERDLKGGSSSVAPSAPLGNELTTLVNDFRSAMAVTDTRFDLSIYGAFINDIPRRLGRNEALDASVRALTIALPSVRTHQQSPEVFKSYATALRCLRDSLRDPVKAVSSETLCAVYLVMVCQGWIGRRGDIAPNHGEAIAHMLNAAVEQNWQGTFESGMTTTLCMISVLESIVNPRIKLDPRLWAFPESLGPRTVVQETSNIESLKLRNLAEISDLLRNSNGRLGAIRSVYDVLQSDCSKMKAILSSVPMTTSTQGAPTSQHLPVPARWLHVRQQTAYGILLSLAITVNSILLLHGDSTSSSPGILELESATYVDEVIILATQAAQYRPLGSSATSLFLMAAWGVTSDAAKQRRLEELMAEYQSDFELTNWLDEARMRR